MTKLGDAIDAVTFNLRRPDRLRAALAAVAAVEAPTRAAVADVAACDAALRKIHRALAMLTADEFARIAHANEPQGELDALHEAALRALRTHQEALLVWRAEAACDPNGRGVLFVGSFAPPVDARPPAEWAGFCVSER